MALLKLFAYSLLGYVLYELVLGFSEGSQSPGKSPNKKRIEHAASEDTGRLSGKTRGRSERTQDGRGTSARHTVGRGVV